MNIPVITPRKSQFPAQPWPLLLKRQLIQKNRLFMSQLKEKATVRSDRLWTALSSGKPLSEQHNYVIQENGQGPYSEYVSVGSNQYLPNEMVECFPYLKHLSQKEENFRYEEELQSIAQRLPNRSSYEEWKEVCRDYAPGLDLVDLVYAYLRLLAEGTIILKDLASSCGCKEHVLLYRLLQMKKLFVNRQSISSFSISIEKGEQITLENVTKTQKLLYCSICLTYDCPRHLVSSLAQVHQFQYVKSYDPDQQTEARKEGVLEMWKQMATILGGRSNDQKVSGCSSNCFVLLDKLSWDNLQRSRKKDLFSPVFVLMVKMGVQLFNFNPCLIRTLFPHCFSDKRSVKCHEIFYYFIQEYSLDSRLEKKFYASEKLHLLNENSHYGSLGARKMNRQKNVKKVKVRHSKDSCNAVCFHYFIDCEPIDVKCVQCHCQKRGYCLPECQCSDSCQIPLRGCRCKETNKCLDRCPCYKANRLCIPGVCQHCHSKDQSNLSSCHNSQLTLTSPKLTRVSTSTIPGAGLGLFAGEFIAKDSFILKYLGEMVQSQNLEKLRQDLSQNSVFYSFKLNESYNIDSRNFGNKARFMNHSQAMENAVPQVIRMKEEDILIFRALKDIREGEELLFNYNGSGDLNDFKDKYPFIK